MTATQLLAALRDLDARVWVEGDGLRLTAPRGALTRELEEELARRKPELVRLLKATRRVGDVAPVKRVSREGRLRLSSFQERMWVLHRLDPMSTAYNLAAWIDDEGPWDPEAMRAAAADLVRRHEILRTTFPDAGGEPRLTFASPGPFHLEILDVGEGENPDSRREMERLATREAHRPVDLAAGPLFRPIAVRLAPDAHAFLIVVHHIVTDGWSMGLALKEWQQLYLQRRAGKEPALAEPPLQYVDHAAWEAASLQSEELRDQLRLRIESLRGAPAVIQLPFDRPRGPTQTFEGGVYPFSLGPELSARLLRECKGRGITPFIAWTAVFGLLLSRYSGQRDLLVGSPAASRKRPEFESMLGPFVNTMVVRHRQDADETGVTLLERTRDAVLAAHASQDVPFERLVEALAPERSLAHPPLFQVACAYHNSPARADFTVTGGGSMYELTLNAFESGDEIHASFEYSQALFDESTVARAADHFTTLLRSLLDDPAGRVDAYPILSESETRLLAAEWNDTEQTWPEERIFIDRFGDRAAEHPDRPAAVCAGERITYGELSARADRLARGLRARGTEEDATVAILVERSLDMLVAALAVMKVGAAYVPLDPAYPEARIAYILEDSGAALVLVGAGGSGTRPSHGLPELPVDGAELKNAGASPERRGDPERLAYVIYTSGSTGKPKGVEVTRGGLNNVLRSLETEPGLGPDDVLLAVTTFAFDIAAVELFLPLAVGATVVIATQDVTDHGRRLLQLAEDSGATVMQATPATWQMLIDAGWSPEDGRRLRAWSGGEALPRGLADELLDRAREVWNLYGPTETSIWSTVDHVVRDERDVSIGRPIANTRVYVVDGEIALVPIGVPGELLIGGAGVARGYRGRDDLTSERFIRTTQGERLYRTGDLVRWGADGRLRYESRLRPPGQGTRQPHRAWRDRVGAGDAAVDPSGGGPCLGRADRSVRGLPRRSGGDAVGSPALPAQAPSGLYDPGSLRAARRAPYDGQP